MLVNPAPDPLNCDPVTVLVADINPPVNKLPLVVLPVTAKLPNVPTDVILVCAAVVKVPTMLVPLRLPPVMLPVADINPIVRKLPLSILPVTETVVPVCVVAFTLAPPNTLPPWMLPVADTLPVTLSPNPFLNLPISLAVSPPLVLNMMSLAV